MSKYKITVRTKTAQTAVSVGLKPTLPTVQNNLTLDAQKQTQEGLNQSQLNKQNAELIERYKMQGIPEQNWPESIRPAQPVVDNTNTPTAGSYANSYFDPRSGKNVNLDQNLLPTTYNQKVYSQPNPSVPSQASQQTMQQINQLNQNLTERNVSNPEYQQLATNPSMPMPNNMNPIRQRALQDQRTVRQQQHVNNQYLTANSALFKALSELNMQNYNAADLQANQEYIQNHINQRFNNNPQFKQLALNLLQQKIKAAGSRNV